MMLEFFFCLLACLQSQNPWKTDIKFRLILMEGKSYFQNHLEQEETCRKFKVKNSYLNVPRKI